MSSLIAGLFCWNCQAQPKFESLDNEGFAEVLKDTTVQLVDVRTPEEFAEGHIPDALNINVMDENFIDLAISSLDRKRTVAVYCRSGRQQDSGRGTCQGRVQGSGARGRFSRMEWPENEAGKH